LKKLFVDSSVIPVFGPVNERLAPILGFLLYDTIEHFIFSNRVVEMGIDPHGISRAAIQRVVSARGLPVDGGQSRSGGKPDAKLGAVAFESRN
jgi:hypothetical protein